MIPIIHYNRVIRVLVQTNKIKKNNSNHYIDPQIEYYSLLNMQDNRERHGSETHHQYNLNTSYM